MDNGLDFTKIQFDVPPIDFKGADISTLPRQYCENIDNYDLDKQKSFRYNQDTKERKFLSHWVVLVVSIWLFWVIFILIFNELLLNLSDTVICMLLGTTTINILGLAYIVLKGLFNSDNK
jgi:hypothetical protein